MKFSNQRRHKNGLLEGEIRRAPQTASNMVAWFSQRYTMSENQYAPLLERQRMDGTWAYRSTQRTRTSSVTPAAGLPDIEFSAMEGNRKLVTHLQRERNPQLAVEKRKAVLATTKRLACECCGFEARTRFHDIESPIVEVHHRNKLGSQEGAKKTSLADLAILCPTCHRAIHQAKDLSVEDFAAKYFSKE
jgi:predicted HNH restriction endonuclease